MVTEQSVFRLADDAAYQSMGEGEETVLLSLSSGYLYTCNDTTAAFLAAIDGRRPFDQVVDALLESYEVARDKLWADLAAMAEKLLAEGIIVQGSQANSASG